MATESEFHDFDVDDNNMPDLFDNPVALIDGQDTEMFNAKTQLLAVKTELENTQKQLKHEKDKNVQLQHAIFVSQPGSDDVEADAEADEKPLKKRVKKNDGTVANAPPPTKNKRKRNPLLVESYAFYKEHKDCPSVLNKVRTILDANGYNDVKIPWQLVKLETDRLMAQRNNE
jgi:hypothetical protein